MTAGFSSLEALALASFPRDFERTMIVRSQGSDGYILIDGGTERYRYLYGLNCHRIGTEWFEGSSGNGGGWSACVDDHTVGTWAVWGDAPSGSTSVRVKFGDDVQEVPVVSGAYLAVWWRTPCPDDILDCLAFP